jgi:hypothetical protein
VVTAPLYLRLVLRELELRPLMFIRGAVLPIVPAAAAYLAILLLTIRLWPPSDLVQVALSVLPAAAVYAVIFSAFSMTAMERRALIGYIRPIPA